MGTMMINRGTGTSELVEVENFDLTENISSKLQRFNPVESEPFVTETDLYKVAHEMQNNIVDELVPASRLTVEMTIALIDNEYKAVIMLSYNRDMYAFTPNSFRQICAKSGMGEVSYMKKCIANKLSYLVPQNLNAWLRTQGDKEFLVRFYKRNVVAFLSPKYGVFDHADALDCLNNALRKNSTYNVEAYSLDIDNMFIRLVDTDRIVAQDDSGGRDKSTVGLILRNLS